MKKARRPSQALRVNDVVRILKYRESGINGYGRIVGILKRRDKRYWVANGNMPFSGTVSDYFDASELRLRPERSPERCPTCGQHR